MLFRSLVRSGAEVCCFDYRGYGENPGSPTEADLHRDARAAWNHLTRSLKIPERRIVLLGESLGGGVATHLAADLCTADEVPGGLVLRSTFNTLTSAASWHFPWLPVNWLLRDRFESQRCIDRVACPGLASLIVTGSSALRSRLQAIGWSARAFCRAPATVTEIGRAHV